MRGARAHQHSCAMQAAAEQIEQGAALDLLTQLYAAPDDELQVRVHQALSPLCTAPGSASKDLGQLAYRSECRD